MTSNIIRIDRTQSFDLQPFFSDSGWTVVTDEEDVRSLALTEIDLAKVCLRSMLRDGEERVSGFESFKRLQASGVIRLDAKFFQIFWENQHFIPDIWKEMTNGFYTRIFFDGTVFRLVGGGYFILSLYWSGTKWCWFYEWLNSYRFVDCPSAVLQISNI